jgi:hypothetical protein
VSETSFPSLNTPSTVVLRGAASLKSASQLQGQAPKAIEEPVSPSSSAGWRSIQLSAEFMLANWSAEGSSAYSMYTQVAHTYMTFNNSAWAEKDRWGGKLGRFRLLTVLLVRRKTLEAVALPSVGTCATDALRRGNRGIPKQGSVHDALIPATVPIPIRTGLADGFSLGQAIQRWGEITLDTEHRATD